MFLRERSTQAEYCDRPDLTAEEVRSVYRQLDRVNRLLHTADSFQGPLVQLFGCSRVRQLTLLDVGAGDGSVGRDIEALARKNGWDWRVTSVDSNIAALSLGTGNRRIAGNACALPFAADSFDVVFASQMTHHLRDAEVVRHFSEAWRVSRDVVLLFDAHRNSAALCFISMFLGVIGFSQKFQADARLSVRRGWRVPEWRRFADEALIPNASIAVQHGALIRLLVRKRS